MLRILVLTLALLNLAYFAWAQGLLRDYGLAPAQQSEAQRLKHQIRAKDVRIMSADEARRADTVGSVPTRPPECLQAGLFDESQAEQLRQGLAAALPPGTWQMDPALEPGRWIVYMGRYPSAEVLAKKRSELASLNLKFEPLGNPALEFGLSLGGYDTEAAAAAELALLTRRGVRTARVVEERVPARGVLLKIAQVDDPMRSRLDDLRPLLAGKPLRPCK